MLNTIPSLKSVGKPSTLEWKCKTVGKLMIPDVLIHANDSKENYRPKDMYSRELEPVQEGHC